MLTIAGDTHTHTIACQHAYSTISENVAQALRLGHRFLALTDHGSAMQGSTHPWYFENLPRFVPQELEGLVLLRGCEANLLDDTGKLDIESRVLSGLDWCIASMHRGLMPMDKDPEYYTRAWLKIAENPHIDCIGHMGHTAFTCDYETAIAAFAKHGKVVEINASSPVSRPGSEDSCRRIVQLCKQYGVPLVLSSDAHFYTHIGQVEFAAKLVTEEGYPPEAILNLEYGRMRDWLRRKKGLELPE